MKHLIKVLLGSAFVALAAAPSSAATLDDVKSRGVLRCGVNTGLPGFASQNDQGEWQGLDIDYCKAVAAAVFEGDASKVEYSPLSAVQRFPALQNGEVDMLARNTTWTMNRDTALGLNFVGVNYYDGQGFMVRKDLNVTSALQLSGATVCVQAGTTTELNLADYFSANNMDYNPVVIESQADVNAAYEQGRCDALTTDASGLYASRLELANPDEHVILPEIISKEPLGPAVRQGDEQWFDIVKWVHFGCSMPRSWVLPGQCRRDAEFGQSRCPPSSRPGRNLWRGHRPHQRLDGSCHQGGRQLRRDFRPECRAGHASQDPARHERPLDEGRSALRAADPLI